MDSREMEVFEKPQWFIRFRGSKLEINQNVLNVLRTIRSYLVVVTAIGSYRTGKSWILNRLAKCSPRNGFVVSDGQTAVTEGIWISCQHHPTKDNCILIFLDTEGLHDPFKKDAVNEDNRLFTVAFLLCSTLIYNVTKNLDDNDLQKIGFITQISEKLQKSETRKLYPEFVLVIRDVPRLKLDGDLVTPDQYLTRVLTSGETSGLKGSSKTCILENFQTKHCFTLTQPLDFEELDGMGQNENPPLKPKYLEDEEKLKEHIYCKADLKRLRTGSACTVKVFCDLAHEVVNVVENGCIPTIPSIQERIAKDENDRVIHEVRRSFTSSLRDAKSDDLYASPREKYSALKTTGLHFLEENLVPESEEQKCDIIQKFKDFAKEEFSSFAFGRCKEEVDSVLEPLIYKFKDNCYRSPEAETQFDRDIENAKQRYFTRIPKDFGLERDEVWKQKEKAIAGYRDKLRAQDLEWKMRQSENRTEVLQGQINEISRHAKEEKREFKRKGVELQEKLIQQKLEMDMLKSRIERTERAEMDRQKAIEERRAREERREAEARAEAANAEVIGSVLSGITNITVATLQALSSLSSNK